jgi:hypothetical protein
VVRAEAEQAGDGLRAGAVPRAEAGIAKGRGDGAGGVAEAEEADERGVELADRDGAAGNGDAVRRGRRLVARVGERLERGAERALRQRLLRLEGGDVVCQQSRLDDGADLRLRPRALGRGRAGRDEARKDDPEEDEAAHRHPYRQQAFPA